MFMMVRPVLEWRETAIIDNVINFFTIFMLPLVILFDVKNYRSPPAPQKFGNSDILDSGDTFYKS
jgi:hypothetical protein